MPAAPQVSDKRQQIIDTAYLAFKRHGYHATGIERIIAEADVARMTMYRHFPSKDRLIVAVLDHRAARFAARLDRLAGRAVTPQAKITTIIDWHERWFRSADFHGCLFMHALAEFGDPAHPVYAAVTAQKHDFRRRLQELFATVLPVDRAAQSAAALFMLLEGATLLAQMGQGEAAIRQIRDLLPRLFAPPGETIPGETILAGDAPNGDGQ